MCANSLKQKKGRTITVHKVIERTIAATKISKNIVTKIKTEDDLRKFAEDDTIVREKNSKIPAIFISIIRKISSEIILKDKRVPTISKF